MRLVIAFDSIRPVKILSFDHRNDFNKILPSNFKSVSQHFQPMRSELSQHDSPRAYSLPTLVSVSELISHEVSPVTEFCAFVNHVKPLASDEPLIVE